ncbi:Protein kinase domain-containing protein [Aphelenchoides fujianensis]|nr:Protein kinase domain-containing protein [Aphelenchoides fujianensis]
MRNGSEKEEGGSSSSEEEEDEGNESDTPATTTTILPLAGSTPPSAYPAVEGAAEAPPAGEHNVTNRYYALKSLYIPTIIEKRQTAHVFNEKRILERLNHRFIVKL